MCMIYSWQNTKILCRFVKVELILSSSKIRHFSSSDKHSTIVRSAHTVLICFVFCIFCFLYIYLRTNSDLCHLQHKPIGFCNQDEKSLHRGTDWIFKYSGLRFVCKGLKSVYSYPMKVKLVSDSMHCFGS